MAKTSFARQALYAIADQLRKSNVFSAVLVQSRPPNKHGYPAVTVGMRGQTVQYLSMHQQPRQQLRDTSIEITAYVKGALQTEIDEDLIDKASVEIEKMLNAPIPGAADLRIQEITQYTMTSDDGSQLFAREHIYTLSYVTSEHDPTTAL